MRTQLFAASFAALLATSALASEGPPYAGSYDDVTYGDIPHASFGVELVRPDGFSVVGSRYDDVRYAPDERPTVPPRSEERVAQKNACTCHA
jgi:hypothetical protein